MTVGGTFPGRRVDACELAGVCIIGVEEAGSMTKTLKRTAAFGALARALASGARGGPPLGRRLAAIPRMIKATLRREYDGGLRLAMMVAATAYVASPIDLAPELFLAVFGLA